MNNDYWNELVTYLIGYIASMVLTIAAFAVYILELETWTSVVLIGLLGMAQLVVQFRFFLHIDLSKQKREDLQLILFSTLLLAIMAGGTIWIVANLATRM